MRFVHRTAYRVSRVDWRNTENLLRLGLFLTVIAIVAAVFLGRSYFTLSQAGYAGVALSALLASGGLVIPIPALAAACTASAFLSPSLIGLIAGAAETVGELTGYYLGYSGRGFIGRRSLYQRLERWMHKRGWLVLLVLSAVPNPVFDVAGITAGALRFPLWAFLSIVFVGKLIKFLSLAYACAWGIDWFSSLFV